VRNILLQGHMLRVGGDALKTPQNGELKALATINRE